MKYILNASRMAEADQRTIEKFHVPQAVLMERAALESFYVLRDKGLLKGSILLIIGPGNNGGDGLALARILNENGIACDVVFPGGESRLNEAEKAQLSALLSEFPEVKYGSILPQQPCDLLIDALFGISLNRPLSGVFLDCVGKINEWHKKGTTVVSLDIPSGVHAGTGQILPEAVRADLTIVFAYHKLGNILYPGAEYNGQLCPVSIGITDRALPEEQLPFALEPEEIALPDRIPYSNKGTYGKVLLAAGSKGMAGAAVLSAKAAYRTGCGLVRVYTHEENRIILQTGISEAVLSTYGTEDAPEKIDDSLTWCSTAAIGPGLSVSESSRELVRHIIMKTEVPVVADADALNIIAEEPRLLMQASGEIVITPHIGEMSRLTGLPISEITGHLIETAVDFARSYHVICVLKDARTVIADPFGQVCINLNGNSGLATAGSGDVLTGIIASLSAQGLPLFRAACLGAAIHGKAGDLSAKKRGQASVMARDIIEEIS